VLKQGTQRLERKPAGVQRLLFWKSQPLALWNTHDELVLGWNFKLKTFAIVQY
jgi:hypothetical protein